MSDELEKLALVHQIERARTYVVTIPCHNCGKDSKREIPYGKLVIDSAGPCPNCGVTNSQVDEEFRRRNANMSAGSLAPYVPGSKV